MSDLAGKLYISTIAGDAAALARAHGLGLEIAEFCTAYNMDEDFDAWDTRVKQQMCGLSRFVLHAPYSGLCPAAIDPMIVDVTKKRYAQAYRLMEGYGIQAMVVHSGFLPVLYDEDWFVTKSVAFWQAFLAERPGASKLYLENVFEQTPALLNAIVRGVDDERFKLCFDVGHAVLRSEGMTATAWAEQAAPFLAHVHLNNNDGKHDAHNALGDGVADVAAVIQSILALAPEAAFTIEAIDAASSVHWMKANGFL